MASMEVKKIQYGYSFKNKPLYAYKIADVGSNHANRKAVILTEGAHGNEYKSILEELINSPKKLEKFRAKFHKQLAAGLIFYVFPMINPDGVEKGSRLSSMGIDLNRDFDDKRLVNQESYFLVNFVENDLKDESAKALFAVDYHCCGGALLPPVELVDDIRSKKIIKAAQKSISPKFQLANTKKFFGKKFVGTLKDYWFSKLGAYSLTYESLDLESNDAIDKQINWWHESISIL